MSRSLYWLAPAILLAASLPLAILATITTTLALTTLLIRVSIVYCELALALLHSWLFTTTHPLTLPPPPLHPLSPLETSPTRHKRHPRRNSVAAATTETSPPHRPPTKSESFASLLGSAGPNRDFEGVGGWSLGTDAQDDSIWIGLNSRLELPTPTAEHGRRHKRSMTSQGQRFATSPVSARMSPAASRARTPNVHEGAVTPESYFSMRMGGALAMSPEESAAKMRVNTSGASSPGSVRLGKSSFGIY